MSTRRTTRPGHDRVHGSRPTATFANVSAVQTTVMRKPPTDEAVAAAGVVRGEDSPKSSGKKNVAPIIATEYDTMARINAGVLIAAMNDTLRR